MYQTSQYQLVTFDDYVFRNTIEFRPQKACFSDLTDDELDEQVLKKTLEKPQTIEHWAIGYLFERQRGFASRFSNGEYPVCYTAKDTETTFFETAFHWQKKIIDDMNYSAEETITCRRSIFKVHCQAMLVDLRPLSDNIPELTDKQLTSYKTTQMIGKQFQTQGLPGLISHSARKNNGEILAVFQQRFLSSVVHVSNVSYQYDPNQSTIKVLDCQTGELCCEV